MRILIVNTLYPPSTVGGAERSVAFLARGIANSGHEVHVACLHDRNDVSEEMDGPVTIHRLPLRNSYWPFRAGRRPSRLARLQWHLRDRRNVAATRDLEALIQRVRPDVLHTNNLQGFSTDIWGRARARALPVVHTLRDYSLLCARGTLFRNGADCSGRCVECRLLTSKNKANSVNVSAAASNSAYVIDAHRRFGYFEGRPSEVIFNIADVAADPQNAAPGREGPPGVVRLGFIGRIEPEKGIEVVLTALSRLAGRNWRLRIAGSGREDYVAGLRRAYPDPRIEWLGFISANDFYGSVDVVIISSIWPEPLPRTMIECLARGKPMLYSNAGGTPEIGHFATQAAQYSKDDAGELAARLDEALAEPAAWRGCRVADPTVLMEFAEDRIVSRYLDLYARAAQ